MHAMLTTRKPMLSKTRSRKGRRPALELQRLIDPRPRQHRQSDHLQHAYHLEPPADNLRATPPIAAPWHNLPGERNPTFQGLTSSIQPRPKAVGCNASLGMLRSGFTGT
jgi:hypothetical protein